MKIRTSIIAASIAAAGMFSGCSDSSLGSQTFGVNLTAVDGYVVKLNSAASASCTSAALGDTKMFYSAAGINTPNGVIPFAIQETYTNCAFNVPSDAILDSDGDKVYTTADTKQVGFAMVRNANVSTEGETVLATPLTTFIAAKQAAGDTVDATFVAAANAFNVMESFTVLQDTTNANFADTMQLATFQNAITTVLQTTANSEAFLAIDESKVVEDMLNDDPTPRVTPMFAGLTILDADAPATFKASVDVTVSILETFDNIASTGEAVNFIELYTKVIDEKVDFSTALDASADTGTFTDTTVIATVTGIEADITTAADDLLAFKNSLPAYMTLGDTLRLGTTDILLTNGTFDATINVSSLTTIEDFSAVVLPSAAIDKSFGDQNIYLETTITNKLDSTDVTTISLGTVGLPMTLAPNEANTSVAITIPSGTPASVVSYVDGAMTVEFLSSSSSEKTHTDLAFDTCTAIDGCTSSTLAPINTYLQTEGKSYDVNITVYGIDDTNLSMSQTSIAGTITTN